MCVRGFSNTTTYCREQELINFSNNLLPSNDKKSVVPNSSKYNSYLLLPISYW